MKENSTMFRKWDDTSKCLYHCNQRNLLVGPGKPPKCTCEELYGPKKPPSIVSYQSTSDGRLVVLGSNGRLYWYHSSWTKDKELHQEWCIYPELPIEAKVNPFKD